MFMTSVIAVFFVMVGLAVNADKVVFQSPTAVMLLCFTIAALVVAVEVYNHKINELKTILHKERIDSARYGLEDFSNTAIDGFHRMENDK